MNFANFEYLIRLFCFRNKNEAKEVEKVRLLLLYFVYESKILCSSLETKSFEAFFRM